MNHSFCFLNTTDYYSFDENNKIVIDEELKKGGLLNLQEYKISFYKNKSYLSNGTNYWTMTSNIDKYYVINEDVNILKDKNNLNQAKIMEYVKTDTIIQ